MKQKYKIMSAVLAGLGVLCIVAEALRQFYDKKEIAAKNITIIGGADGPTSIFLAGKVTSPALLFIAGAVLLLAAAAMIIYARRQKKTHHNASSGSGR